MTDSHLERLLGTASAATVYPPAPDLTPRVLAGIAGTPRARSGLRWSPALGALLLLLAIGLATLLLPPTRDAIARFFGVEGSRIERLPPPPPGTTATPLPPPQGLGGIATPVTVTEATFGAGFEVALPVTAQTLRQPYLIFYRNQPVVVLHYDKFDLWETQLQQNASFGKLLDPDSRIRDVSVRGRPGTWLSGGEHFVSYILPSGEAVQQSIRSVDRSTLIWRTPRAFYRIETDMSLEEALRVAETLP